MEKTDLERKLDDFIEKNKGVFVEKKKNDRHINIKLPDELLQEIQQISYEWNVSLSKTIRILLYLSKMDMLKDLRMFLFDGINQSKVKDITEIMNKGGNDNNE